MTDADSAHSRSTEDLYRHPFGLRGTIAASGPLSLQQSSRLRSWPVVDSSGNERAVIHGLLVEGWLGDGLSLRGDTVVAEGAIASPADFERRVLRGLSGCLVVETLGGALGRRLYPGCGALLPVVFCPDLRRLGSSADQILNDDEYRERFLARRYQTLVGKEGNAGWIPGTLTAHRGVFRLLANHYLDLDECTQHRFWPPPGLFDGNQPDTETVAREVAADMAGFSAAVLQQFSVAIALTSGVDSRLVLGSARGHAGNLQAFTLKDKRITPDQAIPPRLCRVAEIPHRIIPAVLATKNEADSWERLVGHALRSSNREIHPSLLAVDADVLFSGLYGEPARCFFYGHDWESVESRQVSAAGLMAMMKQPDDAELRSDLHAWLQGVPGLPPSTVLDLAYLELRMGSWAMGQAPAQSALCLELMPFAQWAIQERFLVAPLADRASGRLLQRIGELLWSAGMQVPINRFGDWRDAAGPLLRLLRPDLLITARRFLRMKRRH